jgi:hypothetical protein
MINIENNEKVNRMTKTFVNVQKDLAHFPNSLSLDSLQKELIPQQNHEAEPVNVDEDIRLMAQL